MPNYRRRASLVFYATLSNSGPHGGLVVGLEHQVTLARQVRYLAERVGGRTSSSDLPSESLRRWTDRTGFAAT